jgi:hypothetical protein
MRRAEESEQQAQQDSYESASYAVKMSHAAPSTAMMTNRPMCPSLDGAPTMDALAKAPAGRPGDALSAA